MDVWNILADIVVLLGAAVLLGGVFARFGQSPLVGYLLAGMLLGGGGSFGIIQSSTEIDVIAELGVALLLFSLGLEFSPARLKQVGGLILVAGAVQVGATLAICAGGAYLLGVEPRTAIAIGAMVALSSTAVVLRTLSDSGELDSIYGRNALAVLLVQDLAVVPLAMLINILAGDDANIAGNIFALLGLALGLVVVLYITFNIVARYVLGLFTLEHNRELAVIMAVVAGLGSAWAAHALKLSPALGAFLAGMFLGSSPFAHQLRADVASFRIVLLTIFFGAAGMIADPAWMASNALTLLAVTCAILLIKALIVYGLFRLVGHSRTTASTTAICLAQVGEFAFVLGAVATKSGVLPDSARNLIVSVAILSLLITPIVLRYAARLGIWIGGKSAATPSEQIVARPHSVDVIVIGFGPVGRAAVEAWHADPERAAVIDLNKQNIESARSRGLTAHLGDATQRDVLDHIQVERVKLFLITTPDCRSSCRIAREIRKINKAAQLIVRARSNRNVDELKLAGADIVICDEQSSGEMFKQNLSEWQRQQTTATGDVA